jgi:hypothetical protein
MERRERTTRPDHTGERGSILLLTIVVAMIILLTLAAAVSTAQTTSRNTQHALDRTAALSIAEGTTEAAQKNMLNEVANFIPPSLSGSVTIAGESHPYTIFPVGSPANRTDSDGITMAIQTYRISAATTRGLAGATVNRIVDLTMTPLFQYMIFYQNDLEILPGPSMTLAGRVHSNRDIYIGCDNTLTVDSNYLRCTGDILRKRKNDGSESNGTVSIRVKDTTTYDTMSNSEDSENPGWTEMALSTWNGTVQSGTHGVREVATPTIGSIRAYGEDGQKGYYHANADLVVVNDKAYDRSGNLLPLPSGTVSMKTMYDGREGKTIKVTEIDVGRLNSSGYFPTNGLVYAYRTDASSTQPNGVRLANAKEILHPMTVVSQDPLFIKGDFNTVNKKGTAVISDAVNLLSNSWNDTKTAGHLPTASATKYNVAIVTGNVPTPDGGGSYSGGFENLPRFHENWDGVKATIRGAFINIFESEFARSKWVYGGDKYTAPIRDWQFDTALQDMNNLPPFTPNAVYFQRVLWDDGLPSRLQ